MDDDDNNLIHTRNTNPKGFAGGERSSADRASAIQGVYIRPYISSDWVRLCEIHDAARVFELSGAGLLDAFLTLEQTGAAEGLFDATLLVAEVEGRVEGFVGYTEDELTWLYVNPQLFRRGIATALVRAALETAAGPLSLDVLVGNEAALALYLKEGFRVVKTASGKLAGNEKFPATAHVLTTKKDD
jgi:ribosomal protein S18 acetylase RimI-like enzyme